MQLQKLFLSLLILGGGAVAAPSTELEVVGSMADTRSLDQPDSILTCLTCWTECIAVIGGCTVVCIGVEIDPALCGLCIAGAGGSGACVECVPRCFEKGSNAGITDCSDSTHFQRCFSAPDSSGSGGEAGICTLSGYSQNTDNSGDVCSGSKPDCDLDAKGVADCGLGS